jgi:hypothetical protein
VKTLDTTAAGDAFHGGFATALMLGKTPLQSAGSPSAVDAISVTRSGAQPSMPSMAEVEQFLEGHLTGEGLGMQHSCDKTQIRAPRPTDCASGLPYSEGVRDSRKGFGVDSDSDVREAIPALVRALSRLMKDYKSLHLAVDAAKEKMPNLGLLWRGVADIQPLESEIAEQESAETRSALSRNQHFADLLRHYAGPDDES